MAKKNTAKEEKFERLLARLEELVVRLESGELELEEALAAFEEGVKLSRLLSERLTQAQERVEVLLKNDQGELTAAPLDQVLPRGGDRVDG